MATGVALEAQLAVTVLGPSMDADGLATDWLWGIENASLAIVGFGVLVNLGARLPRRWLGAGSFVGLATSFALPAVLAEQWALYVGFLGIGAFAGAGMGIPFTWLVELATRDERGTWDLAGSASRLGAGRLSSLVFVGTTVGYATLHPLVARIGEGRLTFLGAGGWRAASLALSAMALATAVAFAMFAPPERPGREAPESLIKAIAAMLTVAFKSPFGRLMMAVQALAAAMLAVFDGFQYRALVEHGVTGLLVSYGLPAVLGAIALYKAAGRIDRHAARFLDWVGPIAFAAGASAVLALVLVRHPYAWGGLHWITAVLVEAASTGVTVYASVALARYVPSDQVVVAQNAGLVFKHGVGSALLGAPVGGVAFAATDERWLGAALAMLALGAMTWVATLLTSAWLKTQNAAASRTAGATLPTTLPRPAGAPREVRLPG